MKNSIIKTIAITKLISVVMVFLMFFVAGCEKNETEESEKPEFTVCSETMIPDDFAVLIEEKKYDDFKMSYLCNDYLYIAVGYGMQNVDTRLVCLEELRINNKAIYIKTGLRDKKNTENVTYHGEASIYPYIVIRCNAKSLPVRYDM